MPWLHEIKIILDYNKTVYYKLHMKLDEALKVLRIQCDLEGSIRKWAEANDMNFSYVARVLRKEIYPSKKLLGKIGIEKEYTFKKLKSN